MPRVREEGAGAFDTGPGNDPVADRGVRIVEEDKRVLDQNREIDPATLTSIFLVKISAVGAGKTVYSPRAASNRILA